MFAGMNTETKSISRGGATMAVLKNEPDFHSGNVLDNANTLNNATLQSVANVNPPIMAKRRLCRRDKRPKLAINETMMYGSAVIRSKPTNMSPTTVSFAQYSPRKRPVAIPRPSPHKMADVRFPRGIRIAVRLVVRSDWVAAGEFIAGESMAGSCGDTPTGD